MNDPNEPGNEATTPAPDDEVQRTYAEATPPTETKEAPDSAAHDDVAELQAQLAGANAALEKTQRQRALDRALIEAGAIDLDDAHLLLERMDDIEGDAGAVVAELKRRKPHLFVADRVEPKQAPTMGARPGPGRAPALDAAFSAMSTGKRTELLRYMRLKRNGARAASA